MSTIDHTTACISICCRCGLLTILSREARAAQVEPEFQFVQGSVRSLWINHIAEVSSRLLGYLIWLVSYTWAGGASAAGLGSGATFCSRLARPEDDNERTGSYSQLLISIQQKARLGLFGLPLNVLLLPAGSELGLQTWSMGYGIHRCCGFFWDGVELRADRLWGSQNQSMAASVADPRLNGPNEVVILVNCIRSSLWHTVPGDCFDSPLQTTVSCPGGFDLPAEYIYSQLVSSGMTITTKASHLRYLGKQC